MLIDFKKKLRDGDKAVLGLHNNCSKECGTCNSMINAWKDMKHTWIDNQECLFQHDGKCQSNAIDAISNANEVICDVLTDYDCTESYIRHNPSCDFADADKYFNHIYKCGDDLTDIAETFRKKDYE